MPSTTVAAGMPRDSRRSARLRPLRQLAGAGLRVGIRDVAHALGRDVGDLRPGLEHDDPRVGKTLEQQAGIGGTDRAAADDGDGGVVDMASPLRVQGEQVRRSRLRRRRGGMVDLVRQPPVRQQQRRDDPERVDDRESDEDRCQHARVQLGHLQPARRRGASRTACGVRVAASRAAGSPAATPAPISPPTIAVAVVEPIWRTRLSVAVTLPVSLRGAALCATATMMFMNEPGADADEAHREPSAPRAASRAAAAP